LYKKRTISWYANRHIGVIKRSENCIFLKFIFAIRRHIVFLLVIWKLFRKCQSRDFGGIRERFCFENHSSERVKSLNPHKKQVGWGKGMFVWIYDAVFSSIKHLITRVFTLQLLFGRIDSVWNKGFGVRSKPECRTTIANKCDLINSIDILSIYALHIILWVYEYIRTW
jgi:hypothetical protein